MEKYNLIRYKRAEKDIFYFLKLLSTNIDSQEKEILELCLEKRFIKFNNNMSELVLLFLFHDTLFNNKSYFIGVEKMCDNIFIINKLLQIYNSLPGFLKKGVSNSSNTIKFKNFSYIKIGTPIQSLGCNYNSYYFHDYNNYDEKDKKMIIECLFPVTSALRDGRLIIN
jgi:hypothetical protein